MIMVVDSNGSYLGRMSRKTTPVANVACRLRSLDTCGHAHAVGIDQTPSEWSSHSSYVLVFTIGPPVSS